MKRFPDGPDEPELQLVETTKKEENLSWQHITDEVLQTLKIVKKKKQKQS